MISADSKYVPNHYRVRYLENERYNHGFDSNSSNLFLPNVSDVLHTGNCAPDTSTAKPTHVFKNMTQKTSLSKFEQQITDKLLTIVETQNPISKVPRFTKKTNIISDHLTNQAEVT